jgi:hypothetical protein
MTAFPPDGWKRVPAGEFDRLEQRLRWRRWLRHLIGGVVVAVVLTGLGVGAVQLLGTIHGSNSETSPTTDAPCCPGNSSSASTSK